jgi:hypothetical protein
VPSPENPEFRWVLKVMSLPVIEPPPPTPYAPTVGLRIAVTRAAPSDTPRPAPMPVPSALAVIDDVFSTRTLPTPSTDTWWPM